MSITRARELADLTVINYEQDIAAEKARADEFLIAASNANAEAERLRRRVAELEAGGGGIVRWSPATTLAPGGLYLLPLTPGAINVRVNVPDVTLIGGGGPVWATPDQPCIDVRQGTVGTRIIGVQFDRTEGPEPLPGKKFGIHSCVRDRGKGTVVAHCKVGRVDSFVTATDDSDGLTVHDNGQSAAGLRSYWFYIDGTAANATVTRSFVPYGSVIENTCRASPSQGNTPSRLTFTSNLIATSNKACLDLRQIHGATVRWNILASAHKTRPDGKPGDVGTVFSVGPGGKTGINVPDPSETATDVTFADNLCRGVVRCIPGAHGIDLLRNTGEGLRDVDPFILIDARGTDAPDMMVADLRVVRNKASNLGTPKHPVVHVTRGEAMPEGWAVIERNDWT